MICYFRSKFTNFQPLPNQYFKTKSTSRAILNSTKKNINDVIQTIKPICSDESLSIDFEKWRFRKLRYGYPNLVHRTTYNVKRRRFFDKTSQLAKPVCLKFLEYDDRCLIDSIPVPICQNLGFSV